MKDYKREILEKLLKKKWDRALRGSETKRRILLKPGELYRRYPAYDADIEEKQRIHEAAEELERMGMVQNEHLKYSADLDKICLQEEREEQIEAYLQETYQVSPRAKLAGQLSWLLGQYRTGGRFVKAYYSRILTQRERVWQQEELEKAENNFRMLDFLDKNREELYVREASMLVYGDSKWFEDHNYEAICGILREALELSSEEELENEEILSHCHIQPAERGICIKGNWRLQWEQKTLELSGLQGGVTLSSHDVARLKRVLLDTPVLLTVENKTSFCRIEPEGCGVMYLGGFADREQIRFLKMAIRDNPQLSCRHFGDIDVGGFFIHRHLCRDVGADFLLYRMGVEELKDPRFAKCLKRLTDSDKNRMVQLEQDRRYAPVLQYMKEQDVKLEQEIVSYYSLS